METRGLGATKQVVNQTEEGHLSIACNRLQALINREYISSEIHMADNMRFCRRRSRLAAVEAFG